MAHIRGQQPQRLSSGRVRRVNMEPGFQTRGRYSKKRKKTVLVLGVAQMILGLVIIGVSFSVFALTSASRIRHASPCWAGFAVSLRLGGVCGKFKAFKMIWVCCSVNPMSDFVCAIYNFCLTLTFVTGWSLKGFQRKYSYCTASVRLVRKFGSGN